jgi:putative copper resistance protein D
MNTIAITGVLAASGAPSAHVDAHVLLTYFQTGLPSCIADGVLVAIAGLYLLGIRRLRAKGRRWPTSQVVSFLGGLFCIFVAIGSGLAAYDDISLPAHVLQHLFLMMIGAPLLALGRPVTLIAQAGSRTSQVRVLKIVNSRALQVLSGPIAAVLYYGSMWVYFVTPLYAYAGTHDLFHIGTHLYFTAVGYLFWQGIIGLDVSRHRISHALRLATLFLGMPLEAFLGLTIMSMSKPIAPGYTVADTHTGGAVFWISSMLVMAVAIIVSLRQWMQAEDRRAARLDAALDLDRAIAEQLPAEHPKPVEAG